MLLSPTDGPQAFDTDGRREPGLLWLPVIVRVARFGTGGGISSSCNL